MLILRNKFFASKNSLNSVDDIVEKQNPGLNKELLKLLIMNSDGEDVKHWLNEVVNRYIKESIEGKGIDNLPAGYLFLQLDDRIKAGKIKPKLTGKNIANEIELEDKFIASCITAIKTDKSYGNSKYAERPDVKRINEKDKKTLDKYKSCLKLVALSLTGQINPKNFDPFTEFYKVSKLQIDYSKGDLRTLKLPEIRKTIAQALCQGMFYYEIEPSKELLDESGLYD